MTYASPTCAEIYDFRLIPPTDWECRGLLELVEDRCQSGATTITGQCPIGEWHPSIGDPTLADAICDRLLHGAHRMELRGDSRCENQGEPATCHCETPAQCDRREPCQWHEAWARLTQGPAPLHHRPIVAGFAETGTVKHRLCYTAAGARRRLATEPASSVVARAGHP